MKIWERKIYHETRTVGPRHDPYHRDLITMRVNGHDYMFVGCSLAGDGVQLDDGPVMWDYDTDAGNARACFTAWTGIDPDDLLDWYYRRLYVEDPMGPISRYV